MECIRRSIDKTNHCTIEVLRYLLLVSQAAPPTTKLYRVKFDLATETHDDLYATLRSTNSPQYIPPDVPGKVVLGPRREEFTSRPRAWPTLAIAIDDLYLLGFMNSAGDWYAVQGFLKVHYCHAAVPCCLKRTTTISLDIQV